MKIIRKVLKYRKFLRKGNNEMSEYKCNDTEITCKCENCEYHSPDDRCHARGIHIGPKDALNSYETDCATFKSK